MSWASLVAWLIIGALLGGGLAWFAHRSRTGWYRVLGLGLIVAAAIYVGFALRADDAARWLGVEAIGLLSFGAMGWLGLSGRAWWLVAGWGLHPLWDVPLHYSGAGAGIAPDWYAIACLSFDLVVAAYVAARTRWPVPVRT